MLDTTKYYELLEERKALGLNDPIVSEYWNKLADALGDDEQDIIDFINSLDDEGKLWMSEIYEEVVEKFPSDAMETVFASLPKNVPMEFTTINDIPQWGTSS